MHDVIIIGGAGAGLTAGIYAARRGLKTLILTKDIGGQASEASLVENYPGFLKIGGFELMQKFEEQAKHFGVEIVAGEVKEIKEKDSGFVVKANAKEYVGKAVILAFGKTPRSLGMPGEEKFLGKGVSYCATCLPPGSDIIVSNSIKSIENIGKNQLVLTHDGTFKSTIKRMERRYEGKMIKIKTRFFREGHVYLTPNHPVFTTKLAKGKGISYWNFIWEEPQWTPAGKLTKEHILLYPIIKETLDRDHIEISSILQVIVKDGFATYKKKTFSAHDISNKIPLTKEFMRLVGYYLSEGCITTRGINFYFSMKERGYAEDVQKIIRDIFDLNSSIIEEGSVLRVQIYSYIVRDLFEKLFGKYSYNKRMPHWFIYLPLGKQKELVKGIWRGDGCIRYKDVAISTNSKVLAQQLKLILLRFSVIPSISKRPLSKLKESKINGRKIKFKHDMFMIIVGGPFLEKICKILGIEHERIKTRKRKCYHAWIRGGYAFLPIREVIKENYKGHVYNLTVAENNTYVTTNSILHNCDAPLFQGKTVAVVGGGNAALDAALLLSKIAKKVYLIHRRDEFRAFESVVEQARKKNNIEFVLSAIPIEVKGDKFVKSLVVKNVKTNEQKELAVEGVFIEIGSEVKTDFVKGLVDLDDKGQIIINQNCETSKPGIFAAGDVTNVPFKQIVVSAGEGCKAALAAYNYIHGIKAEFVADWAKK